jgi:hypothetical protein
MRVRTPAPLGFVVAAALLAVLAAGDLAGGYPAKAAAPAPAKPAPAKPAPAKAKFPGPAAEQLLKGWGDLAWGATVAEFKKKHPDAKEVEGGRWATPAGADDLGGAKVTAEYGFSKKGQLNTLRFVPDEAGKKTFRATLVENGVLREGAKGDWQSKGVLFRVIEVAGDPFAVAVNGQFKDAVEKK